MIDVDLTLVYEIELKEFIQHKSQHCPKYLRLIEAFREQLGIKFALTIDYS